MVQRKKIAISGKIASGKTTVANHLRDKYGFEQIRSAEYLKLLCKHMAEYNRLMYEVGDYKAAHVALDNIEKCITFLCYDMDYKEERRLRLKAFDLMRRYYNVHDTTDKTDDVRGMLQVVANELLNEIKESIWVDSAIRTMADKLFPNKDVCFVHDDMRYPFEFTALREAGFTLVRLDMTPEMQMSRVKFLYPGLDPSKLTHVSETALDNHKFDYHLDADKPLVEMLAEVNEIVEGVR